MVVPAQDESVAVVEAAAELVAAPDAVVPAQDESVAVVEAAPDAVVVPAQDEDSDTCLLSVVCGVMHRIKDQSKANHIMAGKGSEGTGKRKSYQSSIQATLNRRLLFNLDKSQYGQDMMFGKAKETNVPKHLMSLIDRHHLVKKPYCLAVYMGDDFEVSLALVNLIKTTYFSYYSCCYDSST